MAEPTRVLVLDDQWLIADLLSQVLEDEGYQPVCLTSARAAMKEIAEVDDFDAVITDIDLGGKIDGFDIARMIRQHRPDAAVIYMSGAAGARFQQERVVGALFVSKPFDLNQVSALLGQLLGRTGDDRPKAPA